MNAAFLSPAEAASRLGVSAKALRLYEQRGLVVPDRTSAGWRVYGPAEMARAEQIVALRRFGLSLAQVEKALTGDQKSLLQALATHQAALEDQLQHISGAVEKVRGLRADLVSGKRSSAQDVTDLLTAHPGVAFDLPWPWGGERFVLPVIKPINYIIGPLGSGKTRLAKRLTEAMPDARFLALDRMDNGGETLLAQLADDAALQSRVDSALVWLKEDGATASPALTVLLAYLEAAGTAPLVVDMVEQGLDRSTQAALIAYLRNRGLAGRPLFLMTRSSSIVDLDAVGNDEAILFCPANHSPPSRVLPFAGAPGYEAVATCLATPEVRARSAGMVAVLPQTA